jgi:hypothetical protein
MEATYTINTTVKTRNGHHIETTSFTVEAEFNAKRTSIKFSGSDWYAGSEIKVEGVAKLYQVYVTNGETYRVYKFGKASILVRA